MVSAGFAGLAERRECRMIDKFYEFRRVRNISYECVDEMQGKIMHATLSIDDDISGIIDLTFTDPSVSLPVNPNITPRDIFNNLKAGDIVSIKVIGHRPTPEADIEWRFEFWMKSDGPYVIPCREIKGLRV